MMHPNTRRIQLRASRLLTGMALAFGLALVAVAAPERTNAQAREMLNRLVQSTGNSDPAERAFAQGRGFLDDGKWAQAISTFTRFVSEYPSDKNVDAGLYWLAYAYDKQSKYKEAEGVLSDLLGRFPRSSWADDAKVLRVKVKANLGEGVDVPQEDASAELKIIALKSLCENDRARCSTLVNETLQSSSSPRVKEAAIILLGRYGGAEAVPVLIRMSRSEPNEKLRMRAIRALGNTNDEGALEVLREIAMSPTYADESPTDSAIHALQEHESPRAVSILGDVAINGKNLRARTHAVELLSRRRAEAVTDELFRIYDASPEVQVKKYVLAALGNRRDVRSINKLVEVARSASEVQLRAQAIRAIPNRGEEQDLDVLLPLYDSERDTDLKNNLLEAIGQYKNQRAYQKLEQIIGNSAEPLERRKLAISQLSRSKDPQVLKFLEDMLR